MSLLTTSFWWFFVSSKNTGGLYETFICICNGCCGNCDDRWDGEWCLYQFNKMPSEFGE